MKDNSLNELGGACSILAGLLFFVSGVIYFLLPHEQRALGWLDPGPFLASFAENSTMLIVYFWVAALGQLLGIAAVLAISESVRSTNEGWVRWTSTLAIIGFAATAISFFRFIELDPARATAYVTGDVATKAALTAPGALAGLDPQGWLRFGVVGLWILVVNLLALRADSWSKPLAYVGIATAIGYWLILATHLVQVPTQLLRTIIVGVCGLLLPPLWYIWLGLRLRKAG